MKLSLFEFQERAVERLVQRLKAAHRIADEDAAQTVILSAPTGAGKTVIATAAIEAFIVGSPEEPPDPAATFLWVTDQPELNRQTARKMVDTSAGIRDSAIVDVDADFAEQMLRPGRVYFINTQKLRSGGTLVKHVDERPFTFWDTLKRTIEDSSVNLYVVIDEAHRGAGQTEDDEVLPIMQRFLMGVDTEDGRVPPAPVVLGISATPERFEALLKGESRGRQLVRVDPADVRASGLIKDRLHVVIPPNAKQTDEFALLRDATKEWAKSHANWARYQERYGGQLVEPILMVQVTDANSETQLSSTDVAAAVRMIRDAAPMLTSDEACFAHAFGNKQDEAVGATTLRYLAPADIDADPDVRVVFFKTSLNQGWDCPRAEVMMSFRTQRDATLIAQLVGRMVRTPLARRIAEHDELNSVELFLPCFDEKTVEKVRENLEGVVPSDIEADTAPPVTLVRAEGTEALFDALETIPTYTVPRIRKTKQTRRAMKLAGLLDQHEITSDCLDATSARLVRVLLQAHADRSADASFQTAVAEGGVISVLIKAYDAYGGDIGADDERREIAASSDRADHLYAYAGRVFGASLHKPYWRARQRAEGPAVRTRAKLEAAVLASDSELVDALDREARAIADELLKAHGVTIDGLEPAARAAFDRIRGTADEPVVQRLRLPDSIEARRGSETAPAGHVYVEPGTSDAQIKLGTWERHTLTDAIGHGEVVGWLRNFDRRPYSLTIPYEMGGELRPLFPDLLVVRREEDDALVVDLLDPHNPQLEDAVPKAKGLAAYAAKHGHHFGGIELLVEQRRTLKRIDLQDSARRADVQDISGNDALKKLYQ